MLRVTDKMKDYQFGAVTFLVRARLGGANIGSRLLERVATGM